MIKSAATPPKPVKLEPTKTTDPPINSGVVKPTVSQEKGKYEGRETNWKGTVGLGIEKILCMPISLFHI